MSILNRELMKLLSNQSTIEAGTIICEFTTPGEYTIEIPENGVYEIYCIAPGGEAMTADDWYTETYQEV